MAHLIDKHALIADIEKEIKSIYAGREYVGIPTDEVNIVRGLTKAEDIVNDSLEVKDAGNIWHTLSENDLPRVGECICAIIRRKKVGSGAYVVSGVYRENKFYGKVCNGFDNSIEKGDKWYYLSDLLVSIGEVKAVGLEEEFYSYMEEVFDPKTNGKPVEEDMLEFARHFFELGFKAKQG